MLELQADNEFFVAASVGSIIAILWRRTTMAGVEATREIVERFGAKHPSGFAVLTMVPENSPPPDSETRRKLATMMGRDGAIRGAAVFFEGTGIRVTVIRSVTTGLMLLARPPYPYKVFDSLEGAITFLHDVLQKSGAPVKSTAELLAALLPWRRSARL
ncbi:MAG: hypothetical protein ACOZQL_15165 [Myxococcota bacterium]